MSEDQVKPVRQSRLAAALVVLVVAGVLGPSAHAEPAWKPPVLVATGSLGNTARLFAWGDGGATALWFRYGSQAFYAVDAASRPRIAGGWSTDALGQFTTGGSAVGANATGEVVVGWWAGNQLVLNTRNPRTGTWDQQQLPVWMLQNGKSYGGAGYPLLDTPTIAVGSHGDVAAAWDTAVACDSHCHYRVHAAVRAAGSTSWGPDMEIAPEENRNSFEEQAALDAAGDALLVWVYQPIPGSPVIRASFRPAGGPWQPPLDLVTFGPSRYGDASVYSPSLAMDAAGDAVLAWGVLAEPADSGVFASYRRAGGAWSQPAKLADAVERPQALIDQRGDALVAWLGGQPAFGEYSARYSAKTAKWSSATLVTPEAASVALAPNGNAIAAWNEGPILETALSPSQSTRWSDPVAVTSSYRGSAHVAFDAVGDALALWNDSSGNLFEAGLGGSGPVITSVTTPHRARAHKRLRFAVAAFPWQSPLAGKPHWSFGDGASAKGRTVMHTYRRRGVYKVNVSARDIAGGMTTATATITIAR